MTDASTEPDDFLIDDLEAELDTRRLDLRSADVVEPRVRELATLFPEAVKDGKLDLSALSAVLGDVVDDERERFGLNWPGKRDAIRMAQRPSEATLVPVPDESVNWDDTKNIFIEGENLEVLKVLQRSYHGKVKLIYIDPPYNTGKDFVYPDNYADPLGEYLKYSGQASEDGTRLSANAETSGRYHSAWLSMMWPRLHLARTLLADDGLIVVSIGDAEEASLTFLLDELFGEENRVSRMVWKSSYGGGSKVKHIVGLHEYVLVYARNKAGLPALMLPPETAARRRYKLTDENEALRGPYRLQPLATTSNDSRPNLRYPVLLEGEEVWPAKQWQWSEKRTLAAIDKGEIVAQGSRGARTLYYKQYLRDEQGVERGRKPYSLLDSGPYTQQGTADLETLGLKGAGFAFPKPVDLIRHFLGLVSADAIVLDFFSGSATTGHAVLAQNAEDGGTRRFILAQVGEPYERPDGSASTIAAFSRERLRRVCASLETGTTLRPGFRAYTLERSTLFPARRAGVTRQLTLEVSDRVEIESRSVPELLLRMGFELSAETDSLLVGPSEISVIDVASGSAWFVLGKVPSLEAFESLIVSEPSELVMAESGFGGNDQLKINALQHLKTVNAHRSTPIDLWLV